MKIKSLGSTEVHSLAINGTHYEFTRDVHPPHGGSAYVEIFVRVWTGYAWRQIHRFDGHKEI